MWVVEEGGDVGQGGRVRLNSFGKRFNYNRIDCMQRGKPLCLVLIRLTPRGLVGDHVHAHTDVPVIAPVVEVWPPKKRKVRRAASHH